MKNKMVLWLAGLVVVMALSIAVTTSASESASVPACSAEFEPASGSMYAEGMVTVDHNNPRDCDMNHMSSAD